MEIILGRTRAGNHHPGCVGRLVPRTRPASGLLIWWLQRWSRRKSGCIWVGSQPRNTSYEVWCTAEFNDFQNDEGGQEQSWETVGFRVDGFGLQLCDLLERLSYSPPPGNAEFQRSRSFESVVSDACSAESCFLSGAAGAFPHQHGHEYHNIVLHGCSLSACGSYGLSVASPEQPRFWCA